MTAMTATDSFTLSSEATRGGSPVGSTRSVAFPVMLVVAAALVLAVLIGAPVLPAAGSIALAVGSLVLVGLAWTVAGPRP